MYGGGIDMKSLSHCNWTAPAIINVPYFHNSLFYCCCPVFALLYSLDCWKVTKYEVGVMFRNAMCGCRCGWICILYMWLCAGVSRHMRYAL